MSSPGADSASAPIYGAEDAIAETLLIEQRLRGAGYARLPDLLRSGGDFDFATTTVVEVVAEAQEYLKHQHSVELAGATILAAIGELVVKAQAYDAIARLVRET